MERERERQCENTLRSHTLQMLFFYSIFVHSSQHRTFLFRPQLARKVTEATFTNTLKTLFWYSQHLDSQRGRVWEIIKCSLHHILALVAVFATVDFALGPRLSGMCQVFDDRIEKYKENKRKISRLERCTRHIVRVFEDVEERLYLLCLLLQGSNGWLLF